MFGASYEKSDSEELASIREPYAVFLSAFEAAEEALRAHTDEQHMLEKVRDANATARMLTDTTRRDEALDMVTDLEARWHTPSAEKREATDGGTEELEKRRKEFLEGTH